MDEHAARPPPQEDLHDIAWRYVKLRERKEEIKSQLDEVQKEIDALDPILTESMAAKGVPRICVGDKTISYCRKLWASAANGTQNLVTAIRSIGLDEMLSYSPQRLTSWVREMMMDDNGQDRNLSMEEIQGLIPEALRKDVKLSERTELSVRHTG